MTGRLGCNDYDGMMFNVCAHLLGLSLLSGCRDFISPRRSKDFKLFCWSFVAHCKNVGKALKYRRPC